jgi:hypothetical protein
LQGARGSKDRDEYVEDSFVVLEIDFGKGNGHGKLLVNLDLRRTNSLSSRGGIGELWSPESNRAPAVCCSGLFGSV